METHNPAEHWTRNYAAKTPETVSWYQTVPVRSLAMIGTEPRTIVDAGGGASTLVDHLAARPGVQVCVIDIAASALEHARGRMSPSLAARVRWVHADLTGSLPQIESGWADAWHDRAAFHFLSTAEQQDRYALNLARILRPGGRAVIAAFAPDGPEKCSGLPVTRHDGSTIAAACSRSGRSFALIDEQREEHVTPWGSVQRFVYALLRG